MTHKATFPAAFRLPNFGRLFMWMSRPGVSVIGLPPAWREVVVSV